MTNRVKVTDSTLRDGSHALAHSFTPDQVRDIASALERAGVYAAEVGHGDGLSGSSIQYGEAPYSDLEKIKAAAEVLEATKLAVLLIPGIGTRDDLRAAHDAGATMVRVATHCTEADIAPQHIKLAREMGMETIGFLMMSGQADPATVAANAGVMEDAGAEAVYVVDSAGQMTLDDAKSRIVAVRDAIGVDVGIHAHNNLSLAVANTLQAVDEGVTRVDGCLRGLGAGAGNAQLETLIAVFDRAGIEHGVDLWTAMDASEDVVAPLMQRPQIIDRSGLTLGYAGVYSSFLLHAERAAARFGVDVREILMELGRRKVVGGQEDMIIDVAVQLAQAP